MDNPFVLEVRLQPSHCECSMNANMRCKIIQAPCWRLSYVECGTTSSSFGPPYTNHCLELAAASTTTTHHNHRTQLGMLEPQHQIRHTEPRMLGTPNKQCAKATVPSRGCWSRCTKSALLGRGCWAHQTNNAPKPPYPAGDVDAAAPDPPY